VTDIATANYAALGRVLRDGRLPVRISRTAPRHLCTPLVPIEAAYPPAWLLFSDAGKALTNAECIEAYRAHLDRHHAAVRGRVLELAERGPLALLCWCDVDTALAGACHRRWLADWLADQGGPEIPEHGIRRPPRCQLQLPV
jgi:hypothetical protein